MEKAYNPQDFEEQIYKKWEDNGLFKSSKLQALTLKEAQNNLGCHADVLKAPVKNFSIVLPPPNVTGSLHLGHAEMLAIEDLMIRYKRMKGFDTVWIPGTDHAAIATQNVVEKKLYKEKKQTRHDLGREEFLSKVNDFVVQSKSTIHNQIRKMGASLDWSCEAYTLDETRSKAVKKVFKMMFDDELIYRGYRIVNWCPRCHSTLADDEIDYKEVDTKLYTFKYDADFPIPIATTRPETKLGDTAVAVNPKDKRYKKYIGKELNAIFCGIPLQIKVIGDESVDMEFGTGALGVTPAHSAVDYEMAQRNDLQIIKIINEDGVVVDTLHGFSGLTVLEARKKVIKELEAKKLIIKTEDLKHNLSLCYRCKTAVEPLTSKQWFIDVDKKIEVKSEKLQKLVGSNFASLKELSLAVVKKGTIKIIPERFEKIYYHWMNNLHDWCISRQIWFGHRIPVWYKKGKEIVFIRHGESENNVQNVLNSNLKNNIYNLTELGKEQVKQSAQNLKSEKFDLIIRSPFLRAEQTAEILAQELNIKEILVDERLDEVGTGEFSDKSEKGFDTLRVNFEDWENANPKGIESFVQLKTRVFDFIEEIKNKYPDKNVLAVTHGDVCRVSQSFGTDLTNKEMFALGYPDNAKFIKVKLQQDEYKVSENEISESGWHQDEDTLDTWFSAGLWSFSSMLPQDWDGKDFNVPDVLRFHPTQVLNTAPDILFFWVARMILMTTYVMGDIPFENVYLHGIVRDKDGDKMSKSKPETAIDPLKAGAEFGFDAVRLSMLIGNSAGNDIHLYDEKIAGFRNLVNKLWNISRFIISLNEDSKVENENLKLQSLADKWIFSKFNRLKKEISVLMDEYNFSSAGEKLRDFTWNDLADWYLETSKVEKNKQVNLMIILKELLQMWHPFAPFVTQAIWNNLNVNEELMLSHWPEAEENLIDENSEKKFELIQDLVIKIRNLRAEYKIEPAKKAKALFNGKSDLITEQKHVICALARVESLTETKDKPDKSASVVAKGVQIYILLSDLLDLDKEKERLVKEKLNIEKYIKGLESKLNNKQFVNNAPKEILELEKNKLAEAKKNLEKVGESLGELGWS